MNLKEKGKKSILTLCVIFIVIAICAGTLAYKNNKDYKKISNNSYNMAFYELLNHMQNAENYLLKSLVTNDAGESAKTLIYIWKEANLSQVYLSQIPISNEGLSNTQKFLNQVSEYSYSLSMKSIDNKTLTQEELSKLKELYNYCVETNNTLNQILLEINNGILNWKDLENKGSSILEKESTNISKDSFDSIESNFEEYDGLIYDGAYSEHITNKEKKGLTGDEVSEEKAKEIAKTFIQNKNIKEIISNGLSENGNIKSYTFVIKTIEDNNEMTIGISQKGGHVIFMNYNRNIETENITQDEADKKAIEFLQEKGFKDIKKNYYIKEVGVITLNYAYEQDGVTIYSDLIKVKVALDNGDILGIETTGYLNNHEKRNIDKKNIISKTDALKVANKDLEIQNSKLCIIPTEYKTEIFCWELKGKVEEKEFLIYVNAKSGKVEDILVIIQNENGILTQ